MQTQRIAGLSPIAAILTEDDTRERGGILEYDIGSPGRPVFGVNFGELFGSSKGTTDAIPARLPALSELRSLQIKDAMPLLEFLTLGGTRVTTTGIVRFHEARPPVQLER